MEFVTSWVKAAGYEELASLTGLAKGSIQARAVRLRKAGVKLPKYGQSKRMVDTKGLNALIAQLAKSEKPKK